MQANVKRLVDDKIAALVSGLVLRFLKSMVWKYVPMIS